MKLEEPQQESLRKLNKLSKQQQTILLLFM